jgi:cyclase
MLKTRVIPCLLIEGQRLVKTTGFRDPRYIGDPVNAVRIFNEKEVDELVVLDITATVEQRPPNLRLISELASECFMPLAYGGGVRTLEHLQSLFSLGVEKVVINSEAAARPALISEAAAKFGSQSVIVSIDAKRKRLGGYEVRTRSGRHGTGLDPVGFARDMESAGAGEIFLNSIDRDGTMQGYDLELIRAVSQNVSIPVIACGGAGTLADLAAAVKQGGASAVAAGSMFVFHGRHRAVLINYPARRELEAILDEGAVRSDARA